MSIEKIISKISAKTYILDRAHECPFGAYPVPDPDVVSTPSFYPTVGKRTNTKQTPLHNTEKHLH